MHMKSMYTISTADSAVGKWMAAELLWGSGAQLGVGG